MQVNSGAKQAMMYEISKAIKELPTIGKITIKGFVGFPNILLNISMNWVSLILSLVV